MKNQISTLLLTASWLAAQNACAVDTGAASKSTTLAHDLSVFTMPANAKEGRDPFFPESTRVYDAMMAANQTKQASPTAEISSLKVPGISGTPGHLLAIINNHTFAAGEEGDVLTTSGQIHLQCVEIRPNIVIVKVNGQLHQLKIDQP
jgi:hypothetical protein